MFAFLKKLFSSPMPYGAALYDDAVVQSRRPVFFTDCGVPDALDGRFDLIVLHLCLLRFTLVAAGEEASDGRMLQAMDERFVMDMDHALREIGVGDLSVGKQVKGMMAAYNGRWNAYQGAFEHYQADGSEVALKEGVLRNVYRDAEGADASAICEYCRIQLDHLQDKASVIRSTQATPWAAWPPAGS